MNAQAHLISLGWAGPGHSLDSRPDTHLAYKQKGHRGLAYDPARDPAKVGNTGTGLVKPLSISQRKDRFGIGKKAHVPAAGTDWWLKGFESALGNIGKSESERSSGVSTPIGNAATRFSNGGGKHGGLYGFFVRGQLMQGTMEERAQEMRGTKRKSDALEEDKDKDGKASSENTSSASSTERTKGSGKKAKQEFETVATFLNQSHQDEKRKRRKDEGGEIEQFVQAGQFFEARDGIQKKRRKQKLESASLDDDAQSNTPANGDTATKVETKEERRERRRERKEKKDLKAKLAATLSSTNGIKKHIPNIESDSSDSAAKAARRAERKRRKAEKAKAASITKR